MKKEDVLSLLSDGERLTLECKQAKNDVPRSVWETYSAFANTIGGVILLGIDEHKGETDPAKRFEVVGVSDAAKIITDFWNTINSNKVNENILVDANVESVDVDGKSVIVITVPQADWRVKPVFLNENPYKGSYKRNNEGDFHCTEKEVRIMIRDANEDGNDGVILEGFTMDDIDPNSLHAYRNFFRVVNKDHLWNDIDDSAFLLRLGAYAKDRKQGIEGLTVAGLMMFGKGLSIEERFSNFRMDYLDMSHLEQGERFRDRLTYDGRWESNFYQFLRLVMQKLTFDMPRPFRLEGVQRIDGTPQIEAVREALINAIIHCDVFCEAGILRVEKHDDRLCLRNPGVLLLPIEQVYEGGTSKARNPRIQKMFRMIGYGENVGSGFPQILKAWQDAGWKTPLLENRLDLNEVMLTLFVPEVENDTKGEAKNDTKGEAKDDTKAENDTKGEAKDDTKAKNDTKENLNKNKVGGAKKETVNKKGRDEILKLLATNPSITVVQLAVKMHKSKATILRLISKLKTDKKIQRVGGRKNGYWEISKSVL